MIHNASFHFPVASEFPTASSASTDASVTSASADASIAAPSTTAAESAIYEPNSPADAPLPIAIGDLQGCCDAFRRLLAQVDVTGAPLWLAGDLINRGPDSLQTLRDVMALGPRVRAVLGNHDLA